MRVRVRYRQQHSMGRYQLVRITETKPDNRIFKGIIETVVFSMRDKSKREYVEGVREILNHSEEKLKGEVEKFLKEDLLDMDSIAQEVKDYNVVLDIDLD